MAQPRKRTTQSQNKKQATTSNGQKTNASEKKRAAQRQRAEQERKKKIRMHEITGVVLIASGVFLWLIFFGVGGLISEKITSLFYGLFGVLLFAIPIILIAYGVFIIITADQGFHSQKSLLVLGICISLLSIMHAYYVKKAGNAIGGYSDFLVNAFYMGETNHIGGGIFGAFLSYFIIKFLGAGATYVVFGAVMLICIVFLLNISLQETGQKVSEGVRSNWSIFQAWQEKKKKEREIRQAEEETERQLAVQRENEVERQNKSVEQEIMRNKHDDKRQYDYEMSSKEEVPLHEDITEDINKKNQDKSYSENKWQDDLSLDGPPAREFERFGQGISSEDRHNFNVSLDEDEEPIVEQKKICDDHSSQDLQTQQKNEDIGVDLMPRGPLSRVNSEQYDDGLELSEKQPIGQKIEKSEYEQKKRKSAFESGLFQDYSLQDDVLENSAVTSHQHAYDELDESNYINTEVFHKKEKNFFQEDDNTEHGFYPENEYHYNQNDYDDYEMYLPPVQHRNRHLYQNQSHGKEQQKAQIDFTEKLIIRKRNPHFSHENQQQPHTQPSEQQQVEYIDVRQSHVNQPYLENNSVSEQEQAAYIEQNDGLVNHSSQYNGNSQQHQEADYQAKGTQRASSYVRPDVNAEKSNSIIRPRVHEQPLQEDVHFVEKEKIQPEIDYIENHEYQARQNSEQDNFVNAEPIQEVYPSNLAEDIVVNNVEQEQDLPAQYQPPPIELLDFPAEVEYTTEDIEEKARHLEETLQDFGISAQVIDLAQGPVITRFEIQPAPGVRVNRITNLSDDIALALAAPSVRIEAPIPGKSAVGIEIPNEHRAAVSLRELIQTDEYESAQSKVATPLGKDIAGNLVIADIAKMPHLLIAGSTGSGKSVCINTIICSLLYHATPDEVRLIMVDPKVVELAAFANIPHLLVPIVTQPERAAKALQSGVTEMMARYNEFAKKGVRDLARYNQVAERDGLPTKPQIVIIIDELADLMMVAPNDVEDAICRIAQMGRAAGIHLIVATQRPSSDIITGLIKANVPSRIAFAVASATDSRIILDTSGADKLLGRGDMLFAPIGSSQPRRIQGALVTDDEIERIARFFEDTNQKPCYDTSVIEQIEASSRGGAGLPMGEDGDYDPLLPEIVEMFMSQGQASLSMIQRRMRVGYAKAGRLIDELENMGIVSPSNGSKPREILITHAEFEQIFGYPPNVGDLGT